MYARPVLLHSTAFMATSKQAIATSSTARGACMHDAAATDDGPAPATMATTASPAFKHCFA